MRAFTNRGFYLYESAANFILVDISNTGTDSHEMVEGLTGTRILVRACAMFQGLDGRYVGVAVRTRKESHRLMQAVDAVM